jgi:protein-S-isoprenylcysteine O-methyltransferase Ste14
MKIFRSKEPPQVYSTLSWVLVTIQLFCLFFLFSSAPWKTIRIELQIWQLSGIFLAVSGLLQLSWHSFSIFPEPKTKGRFIRKGIYAYIRHPMYAGVLMVVATLIIQYWSWYRLISAGLLAFVFVLKIVKEEKFLSQKFPEYLEYQKNTNRLIPFVW